MSPAPRKKRKKRRREAEADPLEASASADEGAVEEAAEAEKGDAAEAETNDSAEEPPAPLPGLGTRDGGKLREAHVAFEAGDYKRVRERCKELEANADDPAIREAAAELRSRVEVDPIQIVVLLACAAAVVAIVIRWIL